MTYNIPKLMTLKCFEAASRHLNFHDAAMEINTSAADIDYHIQQIEKLTGYKLFIRGLGYLKLTRAGKDYLPSVIQALDILQKATDKLRNKSMALPVNIHTPLTFMNNYFASHLGDFLAQYPKIDLRVSTNPFSNDINRNNIDMRVKFGVQKNQTQNTYWLTEDLFYPVCSPDYHQKILKNVKSENEALKSATLLHYTGASEDWRFWTDLHHMKDLDTSQGVYFNNEHDMLASAANSQGICISRRHKISDYLQNGRLVMLASDAVPQGWGYFLEISEDRLSDPLIQDVKNWFIKLFENQERQSVGL